MCDTSGVGAAATIWLPLFSFRTRSRGALRLALVHASQLHDASFFLLSSFHAPCTPPRRSSSCVVRPHSLVRIRFTVVKSWRLPLPVQVGASRFAPWCIPPHLAHACDDPSCSPLQIKQHWRFESLDECTLMTSTIVRYLKCTSNAVNRRRDTPAPVSSSSCFRIGTAAAPCAAGSETVGVAKATGDCGESRISFSLLGLSPHPDTPRVQQPTM